jgi:ABC-2 type transport system permease protein
MPTTATVHVTARVFRELLRDIPTMVLFTISPTFVMVLTWGILHGHPATFERVGLIVLGLFPTAPTFLFAAFAIQRERYRGTLEHLMTTPVARVDILLGYAFAFTLPAVVQIAMTVGVTYGLLGLHTAAAWPVVGLMALVSSLLGVAIGLFSANLAHNELQLTKVLAAMAAPHLMLSGLFRPPDEMVGWMHALSTIAPWRYAVSAVAELQHHARPTAALWSNLGVTVGIILLLSAVCLGTVLKRRSP